MTLPATYIIPEGEGQSQIRQKASRFFGYIHPVQSEEEVKNFIQQYRKKYADSTHICYAYRIISGDITEFSTDAGEPSGSAGIPILRSLQSHQVYNVLALVIRYYGGTPLGIPRLIKAYRETTDLALENTSTVTKRAEKIYILQGEYEDEHALFRWIRQTQARVVQVSKHQYIEIEIALPVNKIPLQALPYGKNIRMVEERKTPRG